MYCRADGVLIIIFIVAENKVVINNLFSLTQILVTILKDINTFISKWVFFFFWYLLKYFLQLFEINAD